jgi:hypothetical protein
MTDIQRERARDVLAKWRDGSSSGPWEARSEIPSMSGARWTVHTEGTPGIRMGVHEYQHGSMNLALIVGTAGNPDLLDAIDSALEAANRYAGDDFSILLAIEPLAAAIIAADERMSA